MFALCRVFSGQPHLLVAGPKAGPACSTLHVDFLVIALEVEGESHVARGCGDHRPE